jgi:hypothetical protein
MTDHEILAMICSMSATQLVLLVLLCVNVEILHHRVKRLEALPAPPTEPKA